MLTVNLKPGSRGLPTELVIPPQPAHSGGEGSIYFTPDGKYVAKIYHSASADKQRLLQSVLDLGRNLGEDERYLAWPLGIIDQVNGQPKVGVVTARVPKAYVPLYRLIYSPEDAVGQFRQGRSWLEYLKIARGTAAAVRTIHGKGMAHADVHLKNFLADPQSGEVVLIDLDGLVVKGFLPPQVKGMPGFIAPEVMMGNAQPDDKSDRHSLAVLVLWVLLLRNVMQTQKCYDPDDERHDDELGYGQYACFSENPNDRRNWIPSIGTPLFRNGSLSYRVLTPALQQLTDQALVDGLFNPSSRPQAIAWERALADAYDVLVTCPTCRQSYFYPFWLRPRERRRCPFCGATPNEPYPIVLELQEQRARGSYVKVREIVGYHGLPLFADIAEPGQSPPFTRRDTPIIGETVWDRQHGNYRLLNKSESSWTVIRGEGTQVPIGASVILRSNVLLSLGEGKRLLGVLE